MLPYLPMMEMKQKSLTLGGMSPQLNVDSEVKIIKTIFANAMWSNKACLLSCTIQ